MTRAALATAVDSRPVIIGRWERGEAVPTPEQARTLARMLGLPVGEAAAWEAAAQAAALAGEDPGAGEGLGQPRRRPPAWWQQVRSVLGRGRPTGEPGGRDADAAYPSYLHDPAEQRRYTVRWVLTMAVLAALAIALVWLLGELADGWGAVLDLFRSRPAGNGPPRALSLLAAL